ncbi:hypothetical protein RBU61_10575 [Tissierella sp. MB52-C2]|uniref:hypothetical protein n=1 Tax=Tissierella sp. MB52-C2 TaxID=3070999 RepID=UPI00280A9BE6|nr:hypothetical protein [Tissierella sp. MB52-C2]WMM23400.1 hypothetical protein RBU61_10575 [Tissierella sp. MB52-C2]
MLKGDVGNLNFFIIEHAVNKFKAANREKEIRHRIGYLKACIYNSTHEIDVDIEVSGINMMKSYLKHPLINLKKKMG